MVKPAPGIEKLTPRDSAAWHALRGRDVTASVAGALFGLHPYVTRYGLWARKTGRMPASDMDSENEAMRRGRLLEPVAVALLRERHPDWRITHTGERNVYYRDPAARIGATPDVVATAPGRGRGVVQIKSVEAGVYAREWAPGGAEPEAPEWIMLQASIEAHLIGARWAVVAPLVVSHTLELPLIEVPLMPEVIDAVKAAVAEFWRMVDAGEQPDPDFDRDGPTIDALYAQGDDDYATDLTGDPDIPALIDRRADAARRKREAEAEIAEIDARVKAAMGEATSAHIGGGRRIAWRNRAKPGHYVPPSNFRVLTYPRSG